MSTEPLFLPGQLVATPAALSAMEKYRISVSDLLRRHRHGDWSDMDPEDQEANRQALTNGSRIFGAYKCKSHNPEIVDTITIWVITDAEYEGTRPSTTILMPEDY